MPKKSKQTLAKLPKSILNYFAAFTETKFNFRTLINYKWTNNELTLDLALFQDFQDTVLERIRSGDGKPVTVRNNEHILTLCGNDVLSELEKALSGNFDLSYLRSCVEGEFKKITDRDERFISTAEGIRPADNADLSENELKKQEERAFRDGCRRYNLALRKQIENILVALQEEKVEQIKEELGIEHVPPSTFNSANYLKRHFDALQGIARDNKSEEEYLDSVIRHFREDVEDIVLYDLFNNIQRYARL